MSEAAELSRLLFECRESISMWADVVERQTGKTARYERELVERVDAYRAERGWSLNGFGDESDPATRRSGPGSADQ